MAVREIRLLGDPVLKTRAREVTQFGPQIRAQIRDMMDTMHQAGGVGLASNQIGILNRIFVFDLRDRTHEVSPVSEGMVGHLINPHWQPLEDTRQQGPEGCLSIPGIRANVERYNRVVARGRDMSGRPVSMTATGLLARCIQHECDHLDAKLFLSHLSREDRKAAMAAIHTSEWFNTRTRP